MLSKNQLKFVNSLKQKKNRDDLGLFIAEGEKLAAEILKSMISVKHVFATAKWIAENPSVNSVILVSNDELNKISELSTPNSVLLVCEMPKSNLDIPKLKGKLVIALDDIRDPGNMGTIIRTADWFGIKTIICSLNCVDVYNPKTVQSTMGSITRVHVSYQHLNDFIGEYKSLDEPIYGAVLGGKNIYEQDLQKSGLIVIGNESKGISDELQKTLTFPVSIPSYNSGAAKAESLNAAIATAILCAEFMRRFPIEL
ncbi:MAG: RNA methyltransferase [Bacteroidetes bacterium]|nr:RNA methyltransferase [Bacteroidota bacterium]